jgi:hypothetical protein
MNESRQHFFSRAAFTEDENGDIQRRRSVHSLSDRLH